MSHSIHRWVTGAALALLVLGLAGLVVAVDRGEAAKHRETQRLVVRGDDTVGEAGCQAGVCKMQLTDGSFRGTPVGTGAYAGNIELVVARAFPNGEGGVCAPVRGRLVLGEGSPDRFALAFAGDSCQDGAGDLTASSFTGLARFRVVDGTGAYAHASGGGIGSFSEDAADHERLTLVGSITQ